MPQTGVCVLNRLRIRQARGRVRRLVSLGCERTNRRIVEPWRLSARVLKHGHRRQQLIVPSRAGNHIVHGHLAVVRELSLIHI